MRRPDAIIRGPRPPRALFRRPIPRRALVAAVLGALYAFLLLPTKGPALAGVNLLGVAWLLLSIGLLFLRTLSYHAFMGWSLVWVVWKSVLAYQERDWTIFVDVLVPTVAAVLLMTSRYLEDARQAKAEDEGAQA